MGYECGGLLLQMVVEGMRMGLRECSVEITVEKRERKAENRRENRGNKRLTLERWDRWDGSR